jgi:hypothetical protein
MRESTSVKTSWVEVVDKEVQKASGINFFKSDPEPQPGLDQLVTQTPAAPAFPPGGRPFLGPYCLCYLPLAWPRAALGTRRWSARSPTRFSGFVPPATRRRRPVPRHLSRRISTLALSGNCVGTGFSPSTPIQKFPRWDRKFGHEHFLTKTGPIRARRVCKKGPLKARGWLGTGGGRCCWQKVVFSGGCQIFSDRRPVPAGGVSPFLVDQLVFSLGAVGRDPLASFAGGHRGRSQPPRSWDSPFAVDRRVWCMIKGLRGRW